MTTDKCDPEKVRISKELAKITTELRTVKSEMDDLYKTVYKGNGHPSLVTQAHEMEGRIRGLKASVEDKFTFLQEENKLKFDSLHVKIENKFGKHEGYVDSKFSHLENLLNLQLSDARAEKQSTRSGVWAIRASLIAASIATITSIVMVVLNNS
jgi:hypothetical protein